MNKKRRLRVVGNLACLLIPLLVFGAIIYPFVNADRIFYMEQFEEKRQAFDYMVDYIVELSEKYAPKDTWAYLNSQGDNLVLVLTDGKDSTIIELSDELRKNLNQIKEAVERLYWGEILVTEQGATFREEGNIHAYVYTFNGERPKYMNSPEETLNIESWSMGDGWYYVESGY